MRPAHPRSRGENSPAPTSGVPAAGSSPLTRGKPSSACTRVNLNGLIPAHAGKTSRARREPDPRTAHPRSRGENDPYTLPGVPGAGSSPLTRGKRVERGANLIHVRLIPAHAGKTPDQCSHAARQPAHPRSRGENVHDPERAALVEGSSPLTRGKLTFPIIGRGGGGLIPAHAGKTGTPLATLRGMTAHPPLTRGKHTLDTNQTSNQRLIPAHAGKTCGTTPLPRSRRAHPRSRGENSATNPR